MRRHRADLVGLIFGTAFTIAGVAFLANELTDNDMNPAWAIGLGLMFLGAVALIATLVRGLRANDEQHEHEHAYDASWQHAYTGYGFAGDAARATEPEPEPPTVEAPTSEQ